MPTQMKLKAIKEGLEQTKGRAWISIDASTKVKKAHI